MYIMLIGSPGARKGTAIKMMKAMLRRAGYSTFSADRTRKEKLLVDMADGTLDGGDAPNDDLSEYKKHKSVNGKKKDIAALNLFGEEADEEPREVYIAVDEFNDFIGTGNMDFITFLGNMWDYDGIYKDRIKNGRSVSVPYPTFNIVGGNTATGFAQAFPPEMIGQGFLSRLLMIYGEKTDRKITFPVDLTAGEYANLQGGIQRIRNEVQGVAVLTAEASVLLDNIYHNTEELPDPRFRTYSTRRLTHLIKLCLICAASRFSKEVSYSDVFMANSILSYTETLMPRALGEFGKSKYSETANRVMDILSSTVLPVTMNDLWKLVSGDMDKLSDLGLLLARLKEADKITVIGNGFVAKRGTLKEGNKYFDFGLLTEAKDKI